MSALWIISSRDSLAPPDGSSVLLLHEAASSDRFQRCDCFVDAANHPEHPYAKPLSEREMVELFFSATQLLHG